jgi:hypothetical protein
MTTQGFDKDYYLNLKLSALQTNLDTSAYWADKDTDFLETVFAKHNLTAEKHYELYGWKEGLAPNQYFNQEEYKLAKATAMFNAGGYDSIDHALSVFESKWPYDPYQHYILYGAAERINPSNSFDENAYFEDKLAALQSQGSEWDGKTVQDLSQFFSDLGLTPLTHYLLYGEKEGLVVKSIDSINTITGTDGADRLTGGSGIDAIYGEQGDDIIRGGAGVDKIYAGEGDDTIVIVGDLRGGGKIDTDEDTAILDTPLTSYNGLDFNEDEDGSVEIIDGGDGIDTLYVYGTADISNFNLISIEDVVVRSDVTFSGGFIEGLDSITGDGSSVIRIKANPGATVVLNFTSLGIELKDIGMIEIDENVTLLVNDTGDLGGAKTLIGSGVIKAESGSGALDFTGVTVTEELSLLNEDGTPAVGATIITGEFIHSDGSATEINGTDNDDILDGSDAPEIFDGKKGNDVLSGGGGNDTFIIKDSGIKTILDTQGIDTIDGSGAGSAAVVDLRTGGSIGDATLVLGKGSVAIERQPIDLYLLQDLSGSFSDDVSVVRGLLTGDDGLIDSIRNIQPDTNFGVGAFVDKPVYPFGDSSYGDYVYQTQLKMTRSEDDFVAAVDAMVVLSGADGSEAQLEALYQTALRANTEVGFRAGALRVVLLTTDANFHKSGDHSSAGPNNGDTILDGTPAGTGEDYPTIAQVQNAISESNIYPVFAVTSWNETTYNDLVTQLGTGSVVTLSSDSSNIIDVIEAALNTLERDFIENFIGTQFNDTVTGNSLDNFIDFSAGGENTYYVVGGNDFILGGDDGDSVIFEGNRDEYEIYFAGDYVYVEDTNESRDTYVGVQNVEQFHFKDDTINVTDLKEAAEAEESWVGEMLAGFWGEAKQGYFGEFIDDRVLDLVDVETLVDFDGYMTSTIDSVVDWTADKIDLVLGLFAGAGASLDVGLNIGAGAQDDAAEVSALSNLSWNTLDNTLRLAQQTEGTLSVPFVGPKASLGIERYIEFEKKDSFFDAPEGDDEVTIGFSFNVDEALKAGGDIWVGHIFAAEAEAALDAGGAFGVETTLTADQLMNDIIGLDSFAMAAADLLNPYKGPIMMGIPGAILAAPLFPNTVSGVLARADEVTVYGGGSAGASFMAGVKNGPGISKVIGGSITIQAGVTASAGIEYSLDYELDPNPFNPLRLGEIAWDTINEWGGDAWEAAADLPEDAWDTMSGWGEDAWEYLKDAPGDALERIVDSAETAVDIAEAIVEIGVGGWDHVTGFFDWLV